MKWQFRTAVLALVPFCAGAQPQPSKPSVQAMGEAVIQVKPDQARLTIGVVTQAPTAQAAAALNATQTQATLDKLRPALGAAGEIRTSGYSLNPNYQYPRDGGQPTITGYTASNSIEVTTSDLAGLGKLIDVVVAGGANRIQGVQFTVKNEAPARAQALGEAVRQARANAEAMAAAMGLQLGSVLSLEQGSPQVVRPVVRQFAAAAVAKPTPIEPDTVEVRATVTLTMEVH
ncbi:MAG TPA: SIMPL domain-containing protein [Bryobacteraceae bacterium]|jgi:uncharacterized protein YggE|nr:SIMPL domain-containing protein [Bryobacteraceae bacterium]